MAIQSCYECNKEISSKAIFCPQCGDPQNPVSDLIEHPKVSGLIDKAKEKSRFLRKTFKNVIEYPEKKRQEKIAIETLNALETDIENIIRKEKDIRKKAEQSKRENQKTSVDIEDGVEINGNLLWFLSVIFFIGLILIIIK